MPWKYQQENGELSAPDGAFEGYGYSGHGFGLNNPEAQSDAGIGPIPQGSYFIEAAEDHPHLGPLAMRLTPTPGTQTYGRSGFFIHGDNSQLNDSASRGCVVCARTLRAAINASGPPDRILQVVA